MSSKVDDITINYEEEGLLLVKEIDKKILSKGAWTTIIFRYQNWNRSKENTEKTCLPFAVTRKEEMTICRNPSLIFRVQTRRRK